MSLRDSVVKCCKSVPIRCVDRTPTLFQEGLQDRHRSHCGCSVEGQLASFILDSRATFIGEQGADSRNIGLGTCEVQRILLDSKSMYMQYPSRCLGKLTCPELLLLDTSAPFRSNRSIVASPAASFRLAAIMRGVQPDPSYADLAMLYNNGNSMLKRRGELSSKVEQ